MSVQKQTRLPNVLRNPLTAGQFADWCRDRLEEWEKAQAEAGRTERSKPTVRLVKAALREIEGNVDARIGDQLD